MTMLQRREWNSRTAANPLVWLLVSGCLCAQFPMPTSVAPNQVVVFGPSVPITVTGTGFSSNDVVALLDSGWTSIYPLATTYVDSMTLTAVIPASVLTTPLWAAAGGSIGVSPGGLTPPALSVPLHFFMPYAQITSMTPASALAGSGPVTLSLTGNYYLSGSLVRFDGQDFPANVTSLTELTVVIPASLLSSPRVVQVRVSNQPNSCFGPQWGTEDPEPFTILSAQFDGTVTCSAIPNGVDVSLSVTNGTPGAFYQMLVAAAHPNVAPMGPFFGINLTYHELLVEVGNPPFAGLLDSMGAANQVLPLPGLNCPLNVTVDVVTLQFSPTTGRLLQTDTAQTLNL
jgi:hypothetical protein